MQYVHHHHVASYATHEDCLITLQPISISIHMLLCDQKASDNPRTALQSDRKVTSTSKLGCLLPCMMWA